MKEDWKVLAYWLRDLKDLADRPDDCEWMEKCEEAGRAIQSLLFSDAQWRSNYGQLQDENRYLRSLLKPPIT